MNVYSVSLIPKAAEQANSCCNCGSGSMRGEKIVYATGNDELEAGKKASDANPELRAKSITTYLIGAL